MTQKKRISLNNTLNHWWSRIIPLLIIAICLFFFFYFRLYNYVNFEFFKANRLLLKSWIHEHPFLTVLFFFIIYVSLVFIPIPTGGLLPIACGFLFGPILGSIAATLGTTIAATIIFLAAKTLLHDLLYPRINSKIIKTMAANFQKNTIVYMLFIRLVPIFPFWIVNIVPAFCGINTKIYIFTTLIGMFPGIFIYALIGKGFDSIVEQSEKLTPFVFLRPTILIALAALLVLTLLPLYFIKRHHKKSKEK